MGENTSISWCHATFNPWWGCARVSPGCGRCYAERFAKRTGHGVWGLAAPRRFFGSEHWAEPLKWDRAAAAAGERRRVFCASMADVFEDRPDLVHERSRLWALIRETPHLDWLLLTKRPQNAARMLPASWGSGWPNVWMGTTAEDRPRWDERVPILRTIPAPVHFVSGEPLLGDLALSLPDLAGVDLLILGGESGGGARPCNVAWIRSAVAVAREAGVSPFVKQLGAIPVMDGAAWEALHPAPLLEPPPRRGDWPAGVVRLAQGDAKGGRPGDWPEDLRVREMPR